MPIDKLPSLIDTALAALSGDRSGVGLSVEMSPERARVSMGGLDLKFDGHPIEDILSWELLVDALPAAVEHGRLAAMHDAVGAPWAAPWSVYTASTVLAWLTWASGGAGTPRWRHNLGMILAAADCDGSVAISAAGAANATMSGVLRSRQLLGLIQTGPRSHYIVAGGRLLARDALPHTIAIASAGHDIAAVLDAPWLAGWDITIAKATVGVEGTLLELDEAMVPLEPIPPSAARAAPRDGPKHAPWIVTKIERTALDAVDLAGHRDL